MTTFTSSQTTEGDGTDHDGLTAREKAYIWALTGAIDVMCCCCCFYCAAALIRRRRRKREQVNKKPALSDVAKQHSTADVEAGFAHGRSHRTHECQPEEMDDDSSSSVDEELELSRRVLSTGGNGSSEEEHVDEELVLPRRNLATSVCQLHDQDEWRVPEVDDLSRTNSLDSSASTSFSQASRASSFNECVMPAPRKRKPLLETVPSIGDVLVDGEQSPDLHDDEAIFQAELDLIRRLSSSRVLALAEGSGAEDLK